MYNNFMWRLFCIPKKKKFYDVDNFELGIRGTGTDPLMNKVERSNWKVTYWRFNGVIIQSSKEGASLLDHLVQFRVKGSSQALIKKIK